MYTRKVRKHGIAHHQNTLTLKLPPTLASHGTSADVGALLLAICKYSAHRVKNRAAAAEKPSHAAVPRAHTQAHCADENASRNYGTQTKHICNLRPLRNTHHEITARADQRRKRCARQLGVAIYLQKKKGSDSRP